MELVPINTFLVLPYCWPTEGTVVCCIFNIVILTFGSYCRNLCYNQHQGQSQELWGTAPNWSNYPKAIPDKHCFFITVQSAHSADYFFRAVLVMSTQKVPLIYKGTYSQVRVRRIAILACLLSRLIACFPESKNVGKGSVLSTKNVLDVAVFQNGTTEEVTSEEEEEEDMGEVSAQ